MAVMHRFVVVTGVPGCGKSTVGRALAEHLDFPYFDKDQILETLLEAAECADEETRHRLSRDADQRLEAEALACRKAVLDSFWRHPSAQTESGTPSAWLGGPGIRSVEVLCTCAPELAATRFLNRRRHTGHRDTSWNFDSLVVQSREVMRNLPLRVGALSEVDTGAPVNTRQLAAQVQIALDV